jgi:3-oxoacyl-ACP reductase-like protein
MSIFGSIMEKIFHSAEAVKPSSPAGAAAPAAVSSAPTEVSPSAAASSPPLSAVDVADVLRQKAAQAGGGGNWQTSIVDLLKLLNLDSSLTARKELAIELNVHVGADGSAEENIALHKAVMQKLAENGGRVPESMKG